MTARLNAPLHQRIAVKDSEAALLLGISRSTFRAMVAEGAAPNGVRLRGRVVWRVAELADWMRDGAPLAIAWCWTGGRPATE